MEHTTLYHLKPDFMLDNLRANNYICHLSVFKASLLEAAGGGERGEYNGSQDYDLYLRLTEKAQKIVHIPHVLYYWRASPTSVAGGIEAKLYCLEAAVKALYAHYERGRGGGGRGVHDPRHPRLLQDRLHHPEAGAGQHPDPQLRPRQGSAHLHRLHLRQDHLPQF